MVKEKKITIKHFLSTRIKGSDLSENKFPVYTLVTFNRKNVQLKVWDERYTEEEYSRVFVDLQDGEMNEEIKYNDNFIQKVVRFEYSLFQDKYNLKGLTYRFDLYKKTSPQLALNAYCSREFLKFLEDKLEPKVIKRIKHNELAFVFDKPSNVYIPSIENEYFLVKGRYNKKIKSILPDELKMSITAYSQFCLFILGGFSHIDSFTGTFVDFENWIDGDVRNKFVDYMRYLHLEEGELSEVSRQSFAYELSVEFPFEQKRISHYLAVIDKVVFSLTVGA